MVNEQGETVALDLQLTPELVRAGLAREVIRAVQDARKDTGLEVTDRISLVWSASGELADAVREHATSIADQVLATAVSEADPAGDSGDGWRRDDDLGFAYMIAKA